MQTLNQRLLELPEQYARPIREEKFARAFAHVYDKYFGAGKSAYDSV